VSAEVDAREPGADRTILERIGAWASTVGASTGGRSRRGTLLRWAFLALIAAFLIVFVVTQAAQLPEFEWRFLPAWLAASAAAMACFFVLQPLGWLLILRGLGQPLQVTPAYAVWGKSLLARYVPTNALMIVGRIVLAERFGVPRRVCLASIVYELGLTISCAAALGAYVLITLPALAGFPPRFALLAILPAALLVMHPRVFRPLSDLALVRLGREPLPVVLPFRSVAGLVPVYLAVWSVVGLSLFCFASALYQVPAGELLYVAASQPAAFSASVGVFVLPSGLGARDAVLAAALSGVFPGTVAIAIAVAFRLFQVSVELPFVAVVAWRGRRWPRRRIA
jgi:glycosyltransferase 2 family protein